MAQQRFGNAKSISSAAFHGDKGWCMRNKVCCMPGHRMPGCLAAGSAGMWVVRADFTALPAGKLLAAC